MKAFGTTVVALVLLVSLMAAMAGCSLPSFMGGSGSLQRTAVCFMKAMQSGEITKLLPYMRPEMQILVKAIREIHEKYGDDYLDEMAGLRYTDLARELGEAKRELRGCSFEVSDVNSYDETASVRVDVVDSNDRFVTCYVVSFTRVEGKWYVESFY